MAELIQILLKIWQSLKIKQRWKIFLTRLLTENLDMFLKMHVLKKEHLE